MPQTKPKQSKAIYPHKIQSRVIDISPVVAVRSQSGLSQSQFAKLLGVSVRTFQDWEQGRRKPSGAAQTLLTIAQHSPKVLQELAEGQSS
jgi:putative transcriptional regulator